jgi:hypothetical protein
MTATKRSRQQGQILVIFTGGLVALLVIGALVIDLGFTFLIKRAEQNAADPGAIAAARHIRAGGAADPAEMLRAACFYARQNGFFPSATTNDQCTPAFDPDGTTLVVNYPPSAQAGTFAGSDGAVEVIIGRAHKSVLASVIGLNSITVTSSAVAAFDEGPSNTSSLIALDPSDTCSTGKTHGTGAINIHALPGVGDGGYIHINSSCSTGPDNDTCQTSGQGGLNIDGSGSVTAPHTYVVGTCKASGTLNPPGSLTEGAVVIGDPLLELAPPAFGTPNPGGECGVGTGNFTTPTGPGAGGCKFTGSGTYTMQPGVYYGGWSISANIDLILQPGIYVFAGGGVKVTAGGTITSVNGGSGTPAPVMFYNTDNPVTGTGQADMDFTATGDLLLRAIDSGPFRGILIWNDGEGSDPSSEISLGGQATLDIAGTVYNPQGLVKMEGGSGVGTNSAAIQIIAWQFDIGGNATLDMPYDPNQLYQFPVKGLVR